MSGDPKSANVLIRLGLARPSANGGSVEIAPPGYAALALVAFLIYWKWFR